MVSATVQLLSACLGSNDMLFSLHNISVPFINSMHTSCFFKKNQIKFLDFFLQEYSTIRVSSSLDPDQARLIVGPDMDPYCFKNVISRRH